MRTLFLTLALAGCPAGDAPVDDTGSTDAPGLTTLPTTPDRAVAGTVADPVLWPRGLGAEATADDVLIANDRVRFVVQAAGRSSGGLVPYGGGVIDADRVRHDGTADADVVVDWTPALDVGWLPRATAVEVVDDGSDSGTAVVRVTAVEDGFDYLGAVFEDPDQYPARGLSLVTTYTLEGGSPLMKVETTVTAGSEAATTRPGDVLQSFNGITSSWVPGVGRVDTPGAAEDAVMLVHDEHHLTLGIFADDRDASATPEGALDLLNFLLSFTSLYEPPAEIPAGSTRTWTRWWGVGADGAELTDAWTAAVGLETVEATLTVTGPDDTPVPGVRVTAVVDGSPWTFDVTDGDGVARLRVPAGAEVSMVADGSGSRIHRDLPAGLPDDSPLSAFAAAPVERLVPGTVVPHARGWGRTEGAPGETVSLEAPAVLQVTADAEAFEVQITAVDAPTRDDGFDLGLPDGKAALGYARSGALDMPLEPGTYDVLVWSGVRREVHRERLTVASGDRRAVSADLGEPWVAPGWWLGDTHIHAVPSFDGKLSPTDRALVAAAVGIEVWFSSEHDVAVDHRDLLAALDLDHVVLNIPSVEVTPWVRGHVNVFPSEADPAARAGGAWAWWEDLPDDTPDQFDDLLARDPGVLVQINHPFSPGLPQLAGWEPGIIGEPSKWWDGFDALEVIVPGEDPRGLTLYADLSARGLLSAATGSTDSHDFTVNDPGMWATWFHTPGVTDRADLDGDAIRTAVEGRHTVATNGPLLAVDPLPGSTVTGDVTLDLTVHAPSWMPVATVEVVRDGTIVDTLPVPEDGVLTYDLPGDADASYVFVGRGDTPMGAPSGRRAWVVTSAIQHDVDGEGWTPALPPLQLGD